MNIKSQSMHFVYEAMTDTLIAWTRDKLAGHDLSMNINPDAPMIVQVGDYGYEVQSCGGDLAHEGFVLMCKEKPVCKWEGQECIKL